MTRNDEVAILLEEMADHLDARDVEFKPNSYRRAADSIRGHTVDIETLRERGGETAVKEIDDVGDAIASKVVEYLDTGSIEELEALRKELPVDMDALTAVEGVGPKSVKKLYDALDITTLDELEEAAEANTIQDIRGFGAKTEQNILDNIPFAREARARSLLGEARPIADRILAHFRTSSVVSRVDVAGSLRRWRPTVGDIDILVRSEQPDAVVDHFREVDQFEAMMQAGQQKASGRISDTQVDIRIVGEDSYGAALQYFTGSKDHNVVLRNRAIDRDMKLNEYGLFDISEVDDPSADQRAGTVIAGDTEEAIYAALDMDWMPPELRENRGEIEAAANGTLPDVVSTDDIRGDLHIHTNWSDGRDDLETMMSAAAAFGHEYVAITDHATGPGMVGGVGLDDDDLLAQMQEVKETANSVDIQVFTGVEANIDAEGGISVSDAVLDELDCVIASPHSGLDGDGTERIRTAIEHPAVNIIGHPTGRMLNQRPGHDLDFAAIADAAAANNTALEINADPRRLDLRSSAVKIAVENGAPLTINTDAHSPNGFGSIRYGVHTARRGWSETTDILNCGTAETVASFLDT